MNLCSFRGALVACGVAASMLSTPSQASAWCCLFDWCCKKPQTYAVAPAPVMAPVQQIQQQVSYVPQTCYRTVYTQVPVTTMRPVTTTDPCTGCPVTCMRPETTYCQKAQVVPYTTYRQVVTNVPVNPCCAPATAPAATYYQPGVVSQPAANCCAPAATQPYVAPGPASSSPTFSAPITPQADPGVVPSTSVPSLPPGQFGSQQTFQQSGAPRTFAPDPSLKPIPSASGSAQAPTNGAPRLLDPNDRTTMRVTPRSWAISPAVMQSAEIPAAADQRPAATDSDGWHAAR